VFAGESLAFASNKLFRSFTAGVTLATTPWEWADISNGGAGGREDDETWQNTDKVAVSQLRLRRAERR
jgi:hypothetical protein